MTSSQSIIEKNDQDSIAILAEAVTKAIQKNQGNKRFLDLERIPLICLSIANINKGIDEIKTFMKEEKESSESIHKQFLTKDVFQAEMFPLKSLVYGGAGSIILTILGFLLSSLIKT